MLYDILQDEEFAVILKNHAIDIITYLFEKNQEFGVLVEISSVTFEPELPKNIYEQLPEFTLFLLMNYTYESARLEEGKLVFEAGFGAENFGSVVTVPIEAVLQIIVDETPIFVNLTASLAKKQQPKNSMEALLSNPENRKFLKKEE
ncbi:hypothetical protein NitYY0826_C1636 [Nitratiruptor sp. YY08-26]|uniref:hypothetical protein n=1 Tax=unclassified Nitratiruptor TaxID=2624044 RepID=UPI0019167FFE|nr:MULTISPECIES: hypothetical protein [unclassified Nitratiruptor]BCD62753.1 hypothetical protein NitYY0813_C1634 [Nitratiruptor sp. YY08-13]BCD66689.1 hypothetical protein NitYY0826_C1636 [Nitratiruptor sp. YY08-26]